jgi:TPR repeat protein
VETGDCFYRDLEWAADIYREGAKAGKEVYALYLGYLYLKGLGVKRDVKEARRWFDLGALYQITADKKYQINHTKWIMDHRGMPPELMDAIERGRKKLDGDGADIKRVARWLRIGIHGMTQNDAAAAELDRIARSAKNRPRLSSNDHFQRQFRYYKTLLANGFGTRDPEKRKIEIYRALDGIYNHASMGRHAPSQKIIAEVFDAGELVQKDLFIAYVFYRSAQKNGLDVAEQIEQIRSQLTPEQISEAENDIRQGKIINYYYRDIRKKKLPQHP